MFSRNDVERLKVYFLSSRGDNIAQGELTPKTTDTYDLGRPTQRWDQVYAKEVIADSLSGNPTGSHSALAGLDQDDHTQYVHISTARTITAQHQFAPGTTTAPFTLGANAQGQLVTGLLADHVNKEITAGLGLTGGGLLTSGSGVTLTVSLGGGLQFNGDNIEVISAAPITSLEWDTSNAEGVANSFARSDHTHDIVTSANPSTTAAILATNSSGELALRGLGIGNATLPAVPLHITASFSSVQFRIGYDASNYANFSVSSGATLTIQPLGDLVLDPGGNDIEPANNYDVNLGTTVKKFHELHVGELWVETLVAHETIATVGGRVLVGASTEFTVDLPASTVNGSNLVLNPGFETAGAGGADVFANWIESISGDGTITQDATYKYSGTYSCKIGTGTTGTTEVYQDFSVTAGDYLSLSFWSWSSYGLDPYVARFRVYDVSNTSDIIATGYVSGHSNTSQTWYMTRAAFQVPAGCSSVRVYLINTDLSNAFVYFDDVRLVEGVQISVKHNSLSSEDILYAENGGNLEFFYTLSDPSGAGPYTHYVERNIDGTDGVDEENWIAGDSLFSTGTTGQGFIDLYAQYAIGEPINTSGPTIVGWVRYGDNYNSWSERWAIGNLDGLYGKTDVFGVAIGDYDNNNYMIYDEVSGFNLYAGGGNIRIYSGGINLSGGTNAIYDKLHTAETITWEDSTTWPKANAFIYSSVVIGTYNSHNLYIGSNTWDKDTATRIQEQHINIYAQAEDDLGGGHTEAKIDMRVYGALETSYINLSTQNNAGTAYYLSLRGDGKTYVSYDLYTLSGYGVYIGATSGATANDLRVVSDIALGGSINIGSVGGDPTSGGYINMTKTINISDSYGARIYNTTNQDHTTSSSWQVVTLGSTRRDVYGWKNANSLQVDTAGIYIIGGSIQFAANATGNRGVGIKLNGSTYIGQNMFPNNGASVVAQGAVATAYYLAANDYVQLVAWQTSTGTLAIQASGNYSPELWCVRVV